MIPINNEKVKMGVREKKGKGEKGERKGGRNDDEKARPREKDEREDYRVHRKRLVLRPCCDFLRWRVE